MKRNLGTTDRVIRAILAVVIIVFNATGIVAGVYGIILLVLSAILLLTAIARFCPLYAMLKINTLGHNHHLITGRHQ